MNQDIIQQLKKLSEIKPTGEFTAKSRRLILAVPQKRPIFSFPLAWGAAVAVAILIVVSAVTGGLFPLQPSYAALFNQEDIKEEFNNLNINAQIRETSERQQVNRVIASALNEISDSGPRHLNQSRLEEELNSFKINGSPEKQKQIDELLQKVIN